MKLKTIAHYLLAHGAYWWYGRPARKLIVVGVTGTKGKSSTCRLIASALAAGGSKVGLLSTVEFQIGDQRIPNDKKMTMLGRGQIQKMLRDMVKAGCQYAVVETSSEGILQFRHIGLDYDVAVFTNLGTEHSERHGGFANLRRDKGKLFAALNRPRKKLFGRTVKKVSIVNIDDAEAQFFLQFPADEKITYSLRNKNVGAHSVVGQIKSSTSSGSTFVANGHPYQLNIAGDFNVHNALAAIAVAESQNISVDKIATGLASVTAIAGRMEFIEVGQSYKAIVDFAHEPLSLKALFTNLRTMTTGRIIAVIGSDGGGRDIKKRGLMGEIAGELADIVIVSDVNPYDEDPAAIAEMLAVGARIAGKEDGKNLFVIVDRQAGIAKAVSLAGPNDTIVLTAKGTEPVIAGPKGHNTPWDDREVLRNAIKTSLAK